MCHAAAHAPETGFRHEALLYAGDQEFVDRTVPFLRDGVAAGEPALVVVSAAKVERLRSELGADADRVLFADMDDVGANPARIIPTWRDFVDDRAAPGRGLRGIGEPIRADHSAAELVECQRHESLLNLAFDGTPGFWLMCPYDTSPLDAAVIDEARRSHPFVAQGGAHRESDGYRGLDAIAAPFGEPLPDPPAHATELAFGHEMLKAVREFVTRHASDAGLDGQRADDLMVAAHEVATNSLRYGGGGGVLRLWSEDEAVICEVRDAGQIDGPLVGRERPPGDRTGGYGLWLANQLCELVQIRSSSSGSVVRLHMRRNGAGP